MCIFFLFAISLPFLYLCYVFLWCFPFCNDHQIFGVSRCGSS